MSRRATGTFKIEAWDEHAYSESNDGAKLTRAAVKQAFSGDIEGEGAVEWLMCYRPDQTADFVGLQRRSAGGRRRGLARHPLRLRPLRLGQRAV